jgi:hypothetical protein
MSPYISEHLLDRRYYTAAAMFSGLLNESNMSLYVDILACKNLSRKFLSVSLKKNV